MTFTMLVMTIYLASILVVEHYMGLKELFNMSWEAAEKEFEGDDTWESMSEKFRKGFMAAILLAIMPALAVKLLLNI